MIRLLTPIQTLLFGFFLLILLGATLLLLPEATVSGESTSILDAIFTSASAVTTTGLVVVDTGTHFSIFGQAVVAALFQVGGLGYMLFIALISFGIGSGMSIGGRLIFTESVARPRNVEVKKFVRAVFLSTIGFELAGAVSLTLVFQKHLPVDDAVFSAIFHSVSAFCTAGFSLNAVSFTSYANSPAANAIVGLVTIGGSLGFFVLYDLVRFARRIVRRSYGAILSDHTKLVLVVSASLWIGGTLALFLGNPQTAPPTPFSTRILTASFQALSASTTTGFNSVDIGSLHPWLLQVLIVLMIVGASPGGTGGGIKTTSLGIVLLFVRSVLLNRQDVSVFRRTVPESTLRKALGIVLVTIVFLGCLILSLSLTEGQTGLPIVFEAVSALGTVGLSTGVTPALTPSGKLLIIVAMFVGRVGPLALGYSLVGRTVARNYRYPPGNILVG